MYFLEDFYATASFPKYNEGSIFICGSWRCGPRGLSLVSVIARGTMLRSLPRGNLHWRGAASDGASPAALTSRSPAPSPCRVPRSGRRNPEGPPLLVSQFAAFQGGTCAVRLIRKAPLPPLLQFFSLSFYSSKNSAFEMPFDFWKRQDGPGFANSVFMAPSLDCFQSSMIFLSTVS